MALYNLSIKINKTKVSSGAMLEKLKGPKSKYNKILLHWLQSGFVEGDTSDLWLTNQGITAVEQYRLRKDP